MSIISSITSSVTSVFGTSLPATTTSNQFPIKSIGNNNEEIETRATNFALTEKEALNVIKGAVLNKILLEKGYPIPATATPPKPKKETSPEIKHRAITKDENNSDRLSRVRRGLLGTTLSSPVTTSKSVGTTEGLIERKPDLKLAMIPKDPYGSVVFKPDGYFSENKVKIENLLETTWNDGFIQLSLLSENDQLVAIETLATYRKSYLLFEQRFLDNPEKCLNDKGERVVPEIVDVLNDSFLESQKIFNSKSESEGKKIMEIEENNEKKQQKKINDLNKIEFERFLELKKIGYQQLPNWMKVIIQKSALEHKNNRTEQEYSFALRFMADAYSRPSEKIKLQWGVNAYLNEGKAAEKKRVDTIRRQYNAANENARS